MNAVVRFLNEKGPSLSSDISTHLRKEGRSEQAARQCVSRLPGEVKTLRGLPFPKRARFLYLEGQFGTERYWHALLNAIDNANSAYSFALAGLRARNGIVPRIHFDTISGSPVRQKKHLSGDEVLKRLISVQLVNKVDIAGVGECIELGGNGFIGNVSFSGLRARLLTENFLLDAIRSWAGRMNMASPGTTTIRGDHNKPTCSTFEFDICGPCYLRPLVSRSKETAKPGFFVGDVITGKMLNKNDVSPFLKKCTTLGSLKSIRPFIPILIADSFDTDALRLCRGEGIMATNPESLFGKDVARAIQDLYNTLTNAAAIAAVNFDKVETLFSKLSSIEGSAGNLRGALFELLVGHMVRSLGGGSIDIGQSVVDPKTGNSAEVDVMHVAERVVKAYECKGYQPASQVSSEEIDEWISKRIPTILSSLRHERRFESCKFEFEFWTCGGFSKDALTILEAAKEKTRKYSIGWKDGPAVRDCAKQIKAPGVMKILDEHYFNHPLGALPRMNTPIPGWCVEHVNPQ